MPVERGTAGEAAGLDRLDAATLGVSDRCGSRQNSASNAIAVRDSSRFCIEGWRRVKITVRHPAVDYAHALKEPSDVNFANAKQIALMQDNPSTRTPASLYAVFPAPRRVVSPNSSNGATPPNLEVGSTWPTSNLPFSRINVRAAVSQTNKPSTEGSPLGGTIATTIMQGPTGNSPRMKPASNSRGYPTMNDPRD